jgi:hypothetical protein
MQSSCKNYSPKWAVYRLRRSRHTGQLAQWKRDQQSKKLIASSASQMTEGGLPEVGRDICYTSRFDRNDFLI